MQKNKKKCFLYKFLGKITSPQTVFFNVQFFYYLTQPINHTQFCYCINGWKRKQFSILRKFGAFNSCVWHGLVKKKLRAIATFFNLFKNKSKFIEMLEMLVILLHILILNLFIAFSSWFFGCVGLLVCIILSLYVSAALSVRLYPCRQPWGTGGFTKIQCSRLKKTQSLASLIISLNGLLWKFC